MTLDHAPAAAARAARPAPALDTQEEKLQRLVRTTMLATVFLLGIRSPTLRGITPGTILAILMTPVWLPALRQWWGARVLLGSGVVAIVLGVWLAWIAPAQAQFSASLARGDIILLVTLLVAVGVLLWCRLVYTTRQIGVAFGLGLLANAVLNPGALTATNPWKFGLLVPVTIISLSLLSSSSRTRQLIVTGLLALSCVLYDARSYFATFALVMVLLLWQQRPGRLRGRRAWGWTVSALVAMAVGIYYLGQQLLLEGALGTAAQVRSQAQLDASGSLILGGRPELTATIGLVRDQPFGYGVGALPSLHDLDVARSSMVQILGYQIDAGYVEHFMFGNGFELHSTLGDLWAHFGLGGAVFGLLVGYHVIRGAATRVDGRTASALLLFLSWWTVWNLAFSPFYSALPTLMLTIALILQPGRRCTAERAP